MKSEFRVVNDVDRAKMVLAEQGICVQGTTAMQIAKELALLLRNKDLIINDLQMMMLTRSGEKWPY